MAVKPIPDGYHAVTPYLIVNGVGDLIEFLKKAFGATQVHRTLRDDGSIQHAEVRIGDSPVMMGEASAGRRLRTGPGIVLPLRDRLRRRLSESAGGGRRLGQRLPICRTAIATAA